MSIVWKRYDSIFRSPADFLVCPVNTQGVMGAGLAKSFAERYPEMNKFYRDVCSVGALKIGGIFRYENVVIFPTKDDWRKPSKLEYIVAGLKTFVCTYRDIGVTTSVAFPKLGCGLGGLSWKLVRPEMVKYLSLCDIPVYIYE